MFRAIFPRRLCEYWFVTERRLCPSYTLGSRLSGEGYRLRPLLSGDFRTGGRLLIEVIEPDIAINIVCVCPPSGESMVMTYTQSAWHRCFCYCCYENETASGGRWGLWALLSPAGAPECAACGFINRIISRHFLASSGDMRLIAEPDASARAVRLMRWI